MQGKVMQSMVSAFLLKLLQKARLDLGHLGTLQWWSIIGRCWWLLTVPLKFSWFVLFPKIEHWRIWLTISSGKKKPNSKGATNISLNSSGFSPNPKPSQAFSRLMPVTALDLDGSEGKGLKLLRPSGVRESNVACLCSLVALGAWRWLLIEGDRQFQSDTHWHPLIFFRFNFSKTWFGTLWDGFRPLALGSNPLLQPSYLYVFISRISNGRTRRLFDVLGTYTARRLSKRPLQICDTIKHDVQILSGHMRNTRVNRQSRTCCCQELSTAYAGIATLLRSSGPWHAHGPWIVHSTMLQSSMLCRRVIKTVCSA